MVKEPVIRIPYWKFSLCGILACVSLVERVNADVMAIGPNGGQWIAKHTIRGDNARTGSTQIKGSSVPTMVIDLELLAKADSLGIPSVYVMAVAKLSEKYDLSPSLIEALVWQESRWRHDAVSPKGARGPSQLMPATARYLGVDSDDPYSNLEGGARYLRMQLDRFDNDLVKALAAYNAGPMRVERANGIPRIRETELYVQSILNRLASRFNVSEEEVS